MAAVQRPLDLKATTPRHGGRRAISVLAVSNPGDLSSDEDTPTYNPNLYSSATNTRRPRPTAISVSLPRRPASPTRHSQLVVTADSVRAPRPRLPSAPSREKPQSLSPASDPKFSPKGGRVTPNLPIIEDSDDQSGSDAASSLRAGANASHIRRSSSPSTRRPSSSPHQYISFPSTERVLVKRIIRIFTHNTDNYAFIDVTEYVDGDSIRERILSKLHIPENIRTSYSIYRTEFGGGGSIGGSLDNGQLLLDCQHLSDDRGSLRFLVRRADLPVDTDKTPTSASAGRDLPNPKSVLAPTINSNRHVATLHRQSSSPLSHRSHRISQHASSSGVTRFSLVASGSQSHSGHNRSSSLNRVPSASSLTTPRLEQAKPIPLSTRSSAKRDMDDKRASSSSTSVSSSIPLDDDQESLKIIVEDTGAPLQPAAPPASTDNRSHERQPNTINNPNHFIPSPSSQGKERPIADTMLAPPLNVPVKISRTMSSAEIIQHLVVHGCHDITKDLDSQSCSEYPIASGGFGDVYRGQLRNGPRVAIKCMRIFDPSDGEQQQQKHLNYAAREIHTWSKLRHPHVLRLLGLVTYREKIAMVSPWMEGGPLRHHLKRNTGVNRPQLCTKIADALSYLHQSGVVHGDLKGDNVLMDDAGEPLVTDFGNAVLQERTLNFTFVTTGNHLSSRWAAPELFHSGLRSFESDVYALGMTILEIISGKVPYAGMNDIPAMLAIAKGELPERPEAHIPSKSKYGNTLWSLLQECWVSDRGKRPVAATVRDKMRIIEPDDLLAP